MPAYPLACGSRYDWFALAETRIPTNVGVKFESYSDPEFKQTCDTYGTLTSTFLHRSSPF